MAETWGASTVEVAEVIRKALAYEKAWNAYAHRDHTFTHEEDAEARIAKGVAHMALLDAIRALKERHG